MKRDVIFVKWITIRAVIDSAGRYPAKEWFESLELRDRRRAEAGMTNFSDCEQAGIRNTGRLEPLNSGRPALLELKLTRGGATGPQLRMLGVLRGRTFYAAVGLHKTRRRILTREVEKALTILRSGYSNEERS
jgi:hypothetical protein